MDTTERTEPISYLQSHPDEIVKEFDDADNGPIIITQDGEAKMVVMSIKTYQEEIARRKSHEQRMAVMQLLAIGTQEIADGKFVSEEAFFDEMDKD